MNNHYKRSQRRILIWLLPVLFILVFFGSFPLTLRIADQRYITKVESPAPNWLPVLVITPDNIQVISFGEVEKFGESHPNYSFLIPPGQEAILNKMLKDSFKIKSIDAHPSFKVKQISEGRQLIEAGFYGDGETVVWYEATDKAIYPLSYKSYGAGFGIILAFWGFIISVAACVVVYVCFRIDRGLRWAAR